MSYTAPTFSASSLVFADLQSDGLDGYVQGLIDAQSSAPDAAAQDAVSQLLQPITAYLPIERAKNVIDSWMSGNPVTQATVLTEIADLQYAFLAFSTALAEIGVLIAGQSYTTHVGGTTTGIGIATTYHTFP